MRLIGLTGGIGSGKSSVSRLLSRLGAVIIDADRITHVLEQRGEPVWRNIWESFGWSVLRADGELDRKKLGHRVFSCPGDLQQLNDLVHPAVRERIRRDIDEARGSGAQVAVLDVPLLIEGGLYRIVDEVWVVYAEADQQVVRMQRRDGVSAETAQQRLEAQMPLTEKLAFATRVIENRGTLDELEEVVRSVWQSVVAGAS